MACESVSPSMPVGPVRKPSESGSVMLKSVPGSSVVKSSSLHGGGGGQETERAVFSSQKRRQSMPCLPCSSKLIYTKHTVTSKIRLCGLFVCRKDMNQYIL